MVWGNMMLGADGRALITKEFTENVSWVAPAGVSVLVDLELTGEAGSEDNWSDTFVQVAAVSGGNDVSFSLGTLNNHAESEFSKFSGLGSTAQTISGQRQYRFSNDFRFNDYSGTYRKAPDDSIRKSPATGSTRGWGETGTWYPGDPSYDWNVNGLQVRTVEAAPGEDTSGFGYVAEGGAIGEPGEVVSKQAEPVVPGQSYDLVIPSGGKVVLRYYA